MLLLNISGSAARQTWPLTYLMEQHYHFIFSWGLTDACFFFFFPLQCLSLFLACLTIYIWRDAWLTFLFLSFQCRRKIHRHRRHSSCVDVCYSPLKKQWTEGLRVWTPHISAASTLYCRCLSAQGVDDTVTSGQRNVCVHASTAVCLCLSVFGLK